jgi:hypothetical protein
VLKISMKRILLLTFTMSVIMTFMYGVITFGAGNLSLDKQAYLSGEDMNIKVTGLTDEQIKDQGAWVGIYKINAKSDTYIDTKYINDIDATNIWATKAPTDLSDFEVRVYVQVNDTDTLIDKASFTVESRKAKDGDVSLSKNSLTVNEAATVSIIGLIDSQIADRAWVGIFKTGDPNDKYVDFKYISDLDGSSARTWNFIAPSEFGNYEIRVFTKNVSGDKDLEKTLYAKIPFTVGSTTAGPGDVTLNKGSFLVKEKIVVTINSLKESKTGLTDQQVTDRAWVGIYHYDDDVNKSDYIDFKYIGDLGKTPYQWTLDAPIDYGKYKIVVFTKDVDKSKLSSALYSTTPLSVGSLPAKDGDVKLSKKEFLVGDMATLTLKPAALSTEQIDDNAWFGIFNTTDKIDAKSIINPVNISDIRSKNFSLDFEVPSILGDYELRLYTKGSSDPNILNQAKFTTIPFKVVSKRSNDKNDLKTKNDQMIDNQSFKMGEIVNVIIKSYSTQKESEEAVKNHKVGELSPGQIAHGAWAGIYLMNDNNSAEPVATVQFNDNNIIRSDTKIGSKIWSFTVSSSSGNNSIQLAPGNYMIKVFTQSADKDKRDAVFFAQIPFTILNAVKQATVQNGYNWKNYTLTVTPNPIKVNIGGNVTLNVVAEPKKGASGTPTEVNNLVKFSSQAPGIAKVSVNSVAKGVIKGVKAGATKIVITAKDNSSVNLKIDVIVNKK